MTAAASSATDAAPDPRAFVDELLPKLRSDKITYFPIRHHSPACAAHVKRWIEKHKPASVLIEGPESFTEFVKLLADERCRFPVAVYVNFVDQSGHLASLMGADADADAQAAADTPSNGAHGHPLAPRFSAYYPFCDFSPEAVALRTGREHGARIRFIDLEYPEKVMAGFNKPEEDGEKPDPDMVRIESLTSDPHLTHGEYSKRLAQRLGCRDFDELWDHLFEANWDAFDTNDFVDRMAAYCAMTRLSFRAEDLHRDGTTARELCMAAAIRDELKSNEKERRKGPVLVVTGGFHSVALPDLVASTKTRRPAAPKLKSGESGAWLMRYSFDQFDSLAGYASGLPSPGFYDRMWTVAQPIADATARDTARTESAIAALSEIGRTTRQRKFNPAVTTPDVMAAANMVRQLAALRGHRWPQRQDLLDAVRSCYIKGETDAEGRLILQLVQQLLAGNRIGETPPDAGTPPIVDDFRAITKRLKLPVETVDAKEMALDLYRQDRHREISRLFHRLQLLDVPFAHFIRGPDFVQGVGLDLMNEHWRVAWSPTTDSSLIEASIYGPTISDAAFAKLNEQIEKLASAGEARDTAGAVTTLVRCCRMGLHEHTPRLVQVIDEHIAEDPQLPSVVQGLAQLELLRHSLEPLEAGDLHALPRLMQAAYHRCCRLLEDIATCNDDVVSPLIEALKSLREILQSASVAARDGATEKLFDVELFHQSLRRVVAHPADKSQAAIVGAAAGILYGDGVFSSSDLLSVAMGYLGGTLGEPRKCCGILRGLLATAREVAWHVGELLQALDEHFSGWDEETFMQVLPDMRLAFAELTPREVATVADQVARMHSIEDLGDLVQMDLTEEDVQYALQLNQSVRLSLKTDGFSIEPAAEPT